MDNGKLIAIRVPADLHRAAKILAAQHGTTLQVIYENGVRHEVERLDRTTVRRKAA